MKLFIFNILIVLIICMDVKSTSTTTTNRLAALRKIMKMEALLITSEDEHQSEQVSDFDKRLQYISGFTGSSGDAIITMDAALLWTDGRYHLQAENELDNNWTVMKEGNGDVLSKEEWLKKQFPQGTKIGADPKLIPATTWNTMETKLKKINENFTLIETQGNLIDQIWTGHKETSTIKAGFNLGSFFAGKNWAEKIKETRHELKKMAADAMVVTALDEIAWLLNIRGYDMPYSYFLKAYVLLSQNDTILYTDPIKISGNITAYFQDNAKNDKDTLKFKNYDDIWNDLPNFSQFWKTILVPSTCAYNLGASKKIYEMVPKSKIIFQPSPIIFLKAVKNPNEILGMEKSHIRDGAAMCRFLQYFETHFNLEDWDEVKVAELLNKYRSEEDLFIGVSFLTIVGFGPNGAAPHYHPTINNSAKIFNNNTIVIDSGGQYYDGTTDVTRTIHMGIPTPEQKEAYTRVLLGNIELSLLIFPNILTTTNIDVVARAALWEIGYDYSHGTGHGIGASLNVHESPIRINYKGKEPQRFKPGYFLSNEPGFYKKDDFGIRLENIMEVIEKPPLKYQSGDTFLGFKVTTLVPFDTKLIDFNLLSKKHIKWLNEYNSRIRNLVGGELKRRGEMDAYQWVMEKTKSISENSF